MEIEDVLGNRLRLKILKILSHVRELNVSEIARKLDANHKTVKHHLKVLEEAGILQHRRFGRIHLYRLNETSEKARTVKMLIELWEASKNVK